MGAGVISTTVPPRRRRSRCVPSRRSGPAAEEVPTPEGGGETPAALRPIQGGEKVLRFLLAVPPEDADIRAEPVWVNGHLGLRLISDDVLDTIATMRIDGDRVTGLYFVRNPHKLARVDQEVPLAR